MPSGVDLDHATAVLHADAAETLAETLSGLQEHEKATAPDLHWLLRGLPPLPSSREGREAARTTAATDAVAARLSR